MNYWTVDRYQYYDGLYVEIIVFSIKIPPKKRIVGEVYNKWGMPLLNYPISAACFNICGQLERGHLKCETFSRKKN